MDSIDWVVPHQASRMGLHLLEQLSGFKQEQIINIFPTYGNQIAASIPTAIHELISANKVQKGQKVLLLGSSAGVSFGGIVWQW